MSMFPNFQKSQNKTWLIVGVVVAVVFMFKDKIVEKWNEIVAKK